MAKLYEISAEHNATFLALLEMDDIDDQVFEDTMSALEGELKDKVKSTAAVYQNIDADIAAMKDAEKRIAERRKVLESKAARLKEYIRQNMEFTGTDKLEYPEFKLTLRKAADVLEVVDEEKIPSNYITEKVVKSIDKRALLAALKEGKAIDGCKKVKGARGLMIK